MNVIKELQVLLYFIFILNNYGIIMNNSILLPTLCSLKNFLYCFNHVGFYSSPNSVKKNVVFTGLLFLLPLCLKNLPPQGKSTQ